jgi:hypothetical protein
MFENLPVRRKLSMSSDSGRFDSAPFAGWNETENASPRPTFKNCFLSHAFDCNDVEEDAFNDL